MKQGAIRYLGELRGEKPRGNKIRMAY